MAGIRSPSSDSKKGAARAQFSRLNLCSSVSICGFLLTTLLLGCGVMACLGQIEPKQLDGVLGEELVSPSVSAYQMRHYLVNLVAPPPSPTTADQWSQEAKRLRKHWLDDVVYHGWPRDVIEVPTRFEETGVIETGKGYRIRKLRYEVVPGFYSAALLYEPDGAQRGSPAILNVNGHVGAPGKTVEYKQKRCIQFAKQGILALNLEWLSFGELSQSGNEHWYGAHLDLVGAHELGLFYLAMRRGLDYLCNHPLVDRERIGMTGLSGGGWQTITLSALDPRIKVIVPVAGFSSIASRVEARRYGDLGDIEQSGTDFFRGTDYTHLVGLCAPRPTLLIYNAEDDCCFRAPLVKPLVFDAMRPLFELYGAGQALQWHENLDPGTHNYQQDNRLAAYRFFADHFHLAPFKEEGNLEPEVKNYNELSVGLPTNNLTILGLARKLGRNIARTPIPTNQTERAAWVLAERARLKEVIRFNSPLLAAPWPVASGRNGEVESISYVFDFGNGLSANGVLMRLRGCPENAPVTLVLNDQGKKESGAVVTARVSEGEQVLALDLAFFGNAWRDVPVPEYAQIIHGLGERPLGIMVGQLLEITLWMRRRADGAPVRMESTGLRHQVAVLAAAALEPSLFSEITIHDGKNSLACLLETPVQFSQAPELFCLDLYKYFDLDRLQALNEGNRRKQEAGSRK
jgi:dienelactone hydrolase